jgi:transcriptional regulator GlxA family with amidase domain
MSAAARQATLAWRTGVELDAMYVREGSVFTSVGVTARMDMTLGLVEAGWSNTPSLRLRRAYREASVSLRRNAALF